MAGAGLARSGPEARSGGAVEASLSGPVPGPNLLAPTAPQGLTGPGLQKCPRPGYKRYPGPNEGDTKAHNFPGRTRRWHCTTMHWPLNKRLRMLVGEASGSLYELTV